MVKGDEGLGDAVTRTGRAKRVLVAAHETRIFQHGEGMLQGVGLAAYPARYGPARRRPSAIAASTEWYRAGSRSSASSATR